MNKMLDKVSKLLNQAENASTPEEAATFMAKAQEMASINAIDLTVARMHQANKEKVQEPEERTIRANDYSRKHNRAHYLDLLLAIAEVNDVKYLIGGDSLMFGVGFPADLDVVEALYTHLSVQMATECDEALARGDNKELRQLPKEIKVPIPFEDRDWGGWDGDRDRYYDEHPEDIGVHPKDGETLEEAYERYIKTKETVRSGGGWYGGSWRQPVPPPKYRIEYETDDEGNTVYVEKKVSVVDGRVYRNEFYGAFVRRMRARLWEARRAAERQRGEDVGKDSETALAIVDKKERVSDAHQKQRDAVVHWSKKVYMGADGETHRKSDRTGTGHEHGTKAADTTAIGDAGRGVRK